MRGIYVMGMVDWLFKKPERKPCFPIGRYVLNMMLPDGPPLREFSAADYQAFGAIEFVGQKIYYAPDIEFLGRWWKVNLGVVQGRLFKIALYLELDLWNKTQANEAAFGALTFCIDQLGRPAEQQTGLFRWDTSDGNVILQTGEAMDGFAVNLFLTSRSVREFQRKA
jgi:hypothetical protein